MFGFTRDERGYAVFAGVPLASFLEQHKIPTPAFIYDLNAIGNTAGELVEALNSGGNSPRAVSGNLVAYAMKANSAGTILRTVAQAGAGADVVSGAELQLALAVGIKPNQIVMSGVAKTDPEIDLAIGQSIRAMQVESVEELPRIAARARALGTKARVTLRINPGIRIDSHAHVATGHSAAKFGILRQDLKRAWELIDAEPALTGVGLSTHLGSTLREVETYLGGGRVVCEEARLRAQMGKKLEYVNFGGGFGIDYGKGPVPPPAAYATAAVKLRAEAGLDDHDLLVEPGRSLVGAFGVLVAQVVQIKKTPELSWMMLDVGMNDLLRPALYQAHHRIESLVEPPSGSPWRVAGPVCESTDDFGTHVISEAVPAAVAIRDAGAYGFVMSSEYNGRALAAEVFIRDHKLVHMNPSPGTERWVKSRLSA
ncbi:MAG TPA: diaminopimelate decarboxylase [Polyangiaceae bacterium]|nr:diaminopimelate decarboxylase [Polyangiaceae bacterium]